MLFDYDKEQKTPMSLVLENGISVEGQFIDLRISIESLPKSKEWYQIRHCDDDDSEPASLKRGCVIVNFFGTFICNPIKEMEGNSELEILEYHWED